MEEEKWGKKGGKGERLRDSGKQVTGAIGKSKRVQKRKAERS